MKHLAISIFFLFSLSHAVQARDYDSGAIWQKYSKKCQLERVEKVEKLVKVNKCRVRFKIFDDRCRFSTVTYHTSIGKVLKKAECHYNHNNGHLEILVTDKDNLYVQEIDVFLKEIHDRSTYTCLRATNHDNKNIWFYKVSN